ncbi:IS630 family transposase [Candidatus Woesearchaeota archaeon]|nr:IS630 family transposase [Candidatus Woesearchaeota archaeon]
MLFGDEASFRQDPTLYQTWARIGCQPEIPTMGQRNTLKIFGTIELYCARFLYQFQEVFNAETYIEYLEKILRHYYPRRIHLIQDNASYHKDKDVWSWFSDHRRRIEVHNLPPYSPELNALERIWHHTRLHGTHNRYFPTQDELRSTLTSTFRSIQRNPTQVQGYLFPYQ